MTNVASKNPYDLLGNDPEQDPDREPEPPTKIIDKPVQRTGKRNAAAEVPAGGAARGGSRGGRGESMNDRGGFNNRDRRPDDGVRQDRHANRTREPRGDGEGGRGRGRGRGGERGEGRGGRGYSGRYQRTNRNDREDHSGIGPHEKQAAQGWGDEKSGTAEWNDEVAGAEIARAESQDQPGFTPDTSGADPAFTNGPGAEGEIVGEDGAPVEEDKTKSYDAYLSELAEKRMALGGESLKVRKANEGSKQKFPEGTAHARDPDAENFFIGGGGKAKREKANQQAKNTLQLDGQYYAAADSGDRGRGGRGRGGRGGRGGEFRGRGDGERGGRGRGRGDYRGGPRGGGAPRGGPGGLNTSDNAAFPSLGS